jgi:hypothetical protein
VKSSLKGACLSGLVYPGAGQIFQKHYFRGIALIAIVTASLSATIISAARQARAVVAALESNGGGYDMATVLHEVASLSSGRDNRTIPGSSLAIVGCWVVGIVDAYLSGKSPEVEKAPPAGT